MNVLHYDYYIAIAENRTLSRAARALHVSQSVLSRYLRNLEEEVGIRLFLTSSGCYTLTEAGQIYLQSARRIQLLQSRLQQRLALLDQSALNEIRFGVPPIRGGASLAYIYPHLLEQYPSVHVSITNENSAILRDELLGERLDFILLLMTDRDVAENTDCQFYPLERKQILLGVPSFHALYDEGGTADAPAVLPVSELSRMEDAPFVVPDSRTVIGRRLDHFLEEHHLQLNTQLTTSNRLTNEHLLADGNYAGFPDASTASALPQLHYYTLPGMPSIYEGFAFPKSHALTSVERYFIYLEYRRLQQGGSTFLCPDEATLVMIRGFGEDCL